MRRKPIIHLLALASAMLMLTGCGLTAPRGNEGFANLDSLGVGDTDHVLSLSIGPALLHFAANLVEEDLEAQALLRSLEGVRVRIYEIDGDAARVATRMEGMSSGLQDDGWEAVMTIREGSEQVHMLMRMVDGRICGMTVLVSDGESEAVIVNLMGEIQPEQFSEVMVALDVDAAGVEDIEADDRPAEDKRG